MILVDVQKDFLPGGALAVPKGNEILSVLEKIIPSFDHVIATQDWHPPHHVSFASTHQKKVGEIVKIKGHEQKLWPDHCIQNTDGAGFAESLRQAPIEKIFQKGTDLHVDSYSAFFDNAKKRSTGLFEYLKNRRLETLYFAGLATDYCVLYSALDALALGFKVWIIPDACRGIDPLSTAKALEQMQAKGIHFSLDNSSLKA